MPAYKDSKTGTWFVKFYCKDWTGENKQIKKRGFATKREALDYERNYKIRQENNLDMTFGEFWKLYTEDVNPRVKLNTWLTKENIVEKKILPYFKNLKMNEITPADVRKWQNEILALTDTEGKICIRLIMRCRGMRRLLLTGMLRYRGWKMICWLRERRKRLLSWI